jgi:hypothetical protein
LTGCWHAVHVAPHCVTLLSATHVLPQRWKPALQVKSQVAPLHVAVALAGGAQGEHDAPQLATAVLLTQALPQRWKPVSQVKSQLTPLHVAVALAGGAHGEHDDAPQEATDVFETHWPPQR